MQQSYLVLTVATCSALLVGALWFSRKTNKRKSPTKWKSIGKVKNLCIYPLKGGHRMELKTITCTEYGPRVFQDGVYQFHDRNFIIYKEVDNKYISAPTFPKMSLIKVETYNNESVVLKAPNMTEIIVKVPQTNAKLNEVRVFQDARVITIDCGDEVAQWLSRYIYEKNSGLRLGFHNGSRRRNIYKNSYLKQYCDIYPALTNDATGMYAYLCSYSLINESSVNDLIKRISNDEENISVHNFRGNIIIEDFDDNPYVEDDWTWIKINDVIFYVVKPNTRCGITTMDPDTSVRSKNFEPMTTLKSYRQLKTLQNVDFEGKDPIMGIYMGLHKSGRISVDDIVYIGESVNINY